MKKLLFSLLFITASAHAWTPNKPISVTIGYGAGSTNEIVFRKASEIVIKNNPKVVFVIESKPGAAGVVANNHVVTQASDGYHIGVPSTTTTVIANEIWQTDVKRYAWQDFVTPVVLGESAMALIASPTSGINTFPEFKELVKTPTRNINVATAGGTQTLTYYYLLEISHADGKQSAEIKYGNSSMVAVAVAGNQTEFGITAIGAAEELAKAGKLKILATTAGPDLYITNGYMIVLPPATPRVIAQWYEEEFGKAIQSKEFQNWASANYITVNTKLKTTESVKAHLGMLRSKFSKIVTVVKSTGK